MFKKTAAVFKKYFLAGFLVLVPIGATFSLLRYIITTMDGLLVVKGGKFLYIIPAKYHPDKLLGFHLPGLGLIITIIIILAVGMIAKNVMGRTVIKYSEKLIDKIPFIRSVYNGLKMFMEALFVSNKDHFRRVVLVEMFRKGTYVLAFVTGESTNELQARTTKETINVFIPTTPNPTSGFFVLIPKDETVPLSMTVEEAFKVIMSGGVLTPPMSPDTARRAREGTLERLGDKNDT